MGVSQKNERTPPEVIREDSGPPVTEFKKKPKPGDKKVDVDDAMIEEPKDDVFEKPAKG